MCVCVIAGAIGPWCAGCRIPKKIDFLSGKGVTRVLCGSQFSIALTRDGHVYTW